MVKVAKVTRIVAPVLVFISMVFAIVAIASGSSVPWLVGENIPALNNQNVGGDEIDNDPFVQECLSASESCIGITGLTVQIEFFLGTSTASYCDQEFGLACNNTDEFPVILSRTYDEYMFDEEGSSTPFVMLYDGCPIGSTTVQVTVSLSILLMFGSLVLDALSFIRRFDKPRVSTFMLVLGWAFSLAGLISWILTCQNTSTNLYPGLTIGTGFILLIISIAVGFFAGAVRILRVEDFKYQQQVYI